MRGRFYLVCAGVCAAIYLIVFNVRTVDAQDGILAPVEELGKFLYFDPNLSEPAGQACAACHAPETGFTNPISDDAVHSGAVPTRFGNRKPPSAAYAGDSPVFGFEMEDGEPLWIGGMFWDGRATGWELGDPLAEQAKGPFLNPVEMNLPDARTLCERVQSASYAPLFQEVWGKNSLKCSSDKFVQEAYNQIAFSIAAYERSSEVNPFTSKYDYYLKGQAVLTKQEQWGLELYEGKAMCSACHPSQPGPNGEPPLFTDFTYDNLGVPRNPDNPWYEMVEFNPDGYDWIDRGLGGFLLGTDYADMAASEMGKQKVPTLRNIDMRPYEGFVKRFSHNGYFKSLEEIVHFYNTRDALKTCDPTMPWKPGLNCWPEPEVPENVNQDELGNLGLNPAEEAALVAFLKTLSDGYIP